MPQAVISFANNKDSSSDEIGGASPEAYNVIIDPKGSVHKRPGIQTYPVAPSTVIDFNGIIGIYATNGSKLYAVGGTPNSRHIYKIASGSAIDISNNPNATLRGTLRPIFAETEELLVIAGGSNIQKVDIPTDVSSFLGGNPPIASFVCANRSRLLANDITVDKTKFRFSGISQGSDITGHEQWDADVPDPAPGSPHGTPGFITAEARPDSITALYENTNEVFVFGQDNIQVFVPDSTLIFAPAATREFGCLVPYGVIKKDQEFVWIDQYRRIQSSDARTFSTISEPIKNELDSITNIGDGFGYRVMLGHLDCFVWTFPTDGRTFCYQSGAGWSKWQGWDSSASNFKPIIINSHYLRRDGGINVVGTTDGRLGQLSLDAASDFEELINANVTSGFLDRETDNLKQCKSVKVIGRRGENSSAPLGFLQYRDGTGGWSQPLVVNFGSTGDYDIVREFRGLGTYRRRQWKFTFSDSVKLSLVKVTEEFEILGT